MKNIISYYYNFALEDLSINEKKDRYYFNIANVNYAFIEVDRSIYEIEQIYSLTQTFYKCYKIILNIENKILTMVDDRAYTLLVLHNEEKKGDLFQIDNLELPLKKIEKLLRNNWVNLWSNKIDYFEYQLSHIEMKYPIIRDSMHYFIGLAEVAIAYINETLNTIKPEEVDRLTICRRRLVLDDFEYFNPFNLVIDHKSRDISEYLKGIFWEDKYTHEEIDLFIKKLHFSEFGYRLLMGRMLYPSFYFDMYENVVNSKLEEKQLIYFLRRVREYEFFLTAIYDAIILERRIPKIEFL